MSTFKRGGRAYQEGDVNSYLIDQYLDGQDRDARILENFQSDIEPHLLAVEEAISRMKEIAKGYEDFDFRYEISDSVKELL